MKIPNSPMTIVIARSATMALGVLTSPIVARSVGPDGRGLVVGAQAAMMITPVLLGLGIPMDLRRVASMGDHLDHLRSARIFVIATIPVAVGVGFLLGVTAFAGLGKLDFATFLISMGFCPLFVSILCDQSVLIARRQYVHVAVLQGTAPIVNAALIVVLWVTGSLDVASAMASTAIGTIVATVIGWKQVRAWRGSGTRVWRVVRDGSRYALSQVGEVASARLDQVVVVPLIGAFQAGIYSIAVTVSTILVGIGHAVGSVVFARVASSSDRQERLRTKGEAVRVSFVSATIASAVLGVMAPVAVPFVYGHDFASSVPVTLILLIGSPFMVTAYVALQMLGADGRPRSMTVVQLVTLGTGMVLLFALGPQTGATGAAIASSLGSIASMLLGILLCGLRGSHLVPQRSDLRLTWGMLLRG